MKVHNLIEKIIYILMFLFITIIPLYTGLYRNNYISIMIPILLTIFFLITVYFFSCCKSKKIEKIDVLIFSFSLIYFITELVNSHQLNYALYHFLICILIILISKIFIADYKRRKILLSIIGFSTFITSLLSILSIFPIDFFNDLNLQTDYGDFYPTSIYRLYGLLKYPNCLALISLIGIVISLFKDYSNKLIYKIIIYVNTFSLLLTMSKSIIILAIISILIISFYEYKSLKKQNIVTLFITMFIPIMYSLKLYHDFAFSKNIYILIPVLICLFFIFLLFFSLYKKSNRKKLLNSILIIVYIILITNPIEKQLTTSKSIINISNIVLADLYNIQDNTEYEVKIKYKTTKNLDIIINALSENKYVFIENILYKIVPSNQNEITLILNSKSNKEYYYILLSYPRFTEFTIYEINVKNLKTLKGENIPVNYYLLPTSYVNMFNATKYDIGSINGRISAYKDSIRLISKDNIIFGSGNGYFEKNFNNRRYNFNTIEEHSYILKLLVETGIVGLSLFILICLYSGIIIIRNFKNSQILLPSIIFSIILISSIIDFTMSYQFILILFLIFVYYLKSYDKNEKLVLFVSSSGGHLTELLELKSLFKKNNYLIITEKNKISLKLRKDFKIEYLFYSSRYYIIKYVLITPINLLLTLFYFIKYNPSIIITTGAHTSVPFCLLGKLFSKKVVFIEVFDRIETPTLSGKIVYKLSLFDKFIVQHKKLKKYYKKAIYIPGGII